MKVTKVIFDGDGNGATGLQTKIQLWNRTGSGWPDVVFSEQANDPVWMGQKPFDFAADLNKVFPKNLIAGWPKPSLAQCTVNGRLVCLQDNLAQEVLYYNKKLMKQFGYKVPKTWQQWAAIGTEGRQAASRLHHRHRRRLVRSLAVPVGRPVPDRAGRGAEDGQDQRDRRALHADGEAARSAAQERRRPARERLHAGLRQEVRRRQGQDPDDAGPDLVRAGDLVRRRRSGSRPARSRPPLPLRWNKEPLTTGQVGGGPWIISKHTKNKDAAVDFVKWVTTTNEAKERAGGYPAYRPAANFQLYKLDHDKYFAAPPGPAMKAAAGLIWKGWSMVTYPDQPSGRTRSSRSSSRASR